MHDARPTPLVSRAVAVALIALLAPLGVLLWAIVKLDSVGPVLFRQRRIGFLGREFTVYKVRTMAVGSERATALGTRGDGAYVTRVGRVLRKLKIDELPQLWNVARGEMAFVGPRPIPLPLHREMVQRIPGFALRNQVPPGLTNLSQITLADNKLGDHLVEDWQVRLEGELHYIAHKNVWYDLTILAMTALFVLRRALRLDRRGHARPHAA
ncbi:MAG TPA: sugar transferase [Candidatus Binatia bacterium]|nr:sugar transferase [Candidatus Binatia bacterium]